MAKADLNGFLINVQQIYDFPSYLTDLIVTSVLSDIREVELKMILDEQRTKKHRLEKPKAKEVK